MNGVDEHHDYEKVGRALDLRLLRRLAPFVRGDALGLGLGFGLLFAITGLEVLGPWLLKLALDGPVARAVPDPAALATGTAMAAPWNPPPGVLRELLLLGAAYAACLLATLLIRYVQFLLLNRAGQSILRRVRDATFAHLQRLPIAYFDRQASGRLVSRVTTDVETLNELFTSGLITLAADILKVVVLLAVAFSLNARLALLAAISVPVVACASAWFRLRARQAYRETRSAIARVTAYLGEAIAGIRVIQGFAREDKAGSTFAERNHGYLLANLKTVFYFALFFPVVDWITYAVQGGVFWRGGIEILGSTLTVGGFLQFWYYLNFMFEPLRELAEKYNVLQSAMASSERIFQVLDTAPEPPDPQQAQSAARITGDIRFENVHFAYGSGPPVLKGVSFHVRAGQTVALVGATGSGKTTITSLILRLYEPRLGRILVDGVDIREYGRADLRARVAYVPQDVFLFTGTILDNLRMGSSDIDEGRARAAAQAIGADRFIRRLPDGYQHRLAERGADLSAGERQMLSFARALAVDPAILVLDEATANIDPQTEQRIQHAIDRLLEGRTSVVVAHRLSTIRRADLILVLHHGEIREQGTHAQLMQMGGLYRRLHDLQFAAGTAG